MHSPVITPQTIDESQAFLDGDQLAAFREIAEEQKAESELGNILGGNFPSRERPGRP